MTSKKLISPVKKNNNINKYIIVPNYLCELKTT